MEESIYGWVREVVPPPVKNDLYQSKHSGDLAPTGSTFSRANLAGFGAMSEVRKECGTFGKTKETDKEKTILHRKSAQVASLKDMKNKCPTSLQPTKLKPKIKARIPDPADKPICGLSSAKNFVVANAVEAILTNPKKILVEEEDFKTKVDFGQVPKYMSKIKDDIEKEREYIIELRTREKQSNVSSRPLAEEERERLTTLLKAKWEEVNRNYQATTHLTNLDTIGKVKNKENNEKMLNQYEKDIATLSKANVNIETSK